MLPSSAPRETPPGATPLHLAAGISRPRPAVPATAVVAAALSRRASLPGAAAELAVSIERIHSYCAQACSSTMARARKATRPLACIDALAPTLPRALHRHSSMHLLIVEPTVPRARSMGTRILYTAVGRGGGCPTSAAACRGRDIRAPRLSSACAARRRVAHALARCQPRGGPPPAAARPQDFRTPMWARVCSEMPAAAASPRYHGPVLEMGRPLARAPAGVALGHCV